jgi:hypothetical protein
VAGDLSSPDEETTAVADVLVINFLQLEIPSKLHSDQDMTPVGVGPEPDNPQVVGKSSATTTGCNYGIINVGSGDNLRISAWIFHSGRHDILPLSLPSYKAPAHEILAARYPSVKRSKRSYACFGVGAPSNKEKPTIDCM